MSGNRIALKRRPARNPKRLAKLSIIGRKPIRSKTRRVAESFANTSHGCL